MKHPGMVEIQQTANITDLSLPYLSSHAMSVFDILIDEYLDKIRSWFTINETSCYRERPHVDVETEFHLRNFYGGNSRLLQKGCYLGRRSQL